MTQPSQRATPGTSLQITFDAFVRAATQRLTDEQIVTLIAQLKDELIARATSRVGGSDQLIDERPRGGRSA